MRSKIENAFTFDVFLVFDYNFIESGEKLNKLRNIVIDLNNRLAKPRGFNYKIYLVYLF